MRTTIAIGIVIAGVLGHTARAEDSAAPITDPPPASPALRIDPLLLVDLDYRLFPRDEEGASGFSVARLRSGLSVTPTDGVSALAIVEYALEHATILDAAITLRAAPGVDVIVGYSKPPLVASFAHEPTHTLPFSERSPVVNAFRVRRDAGLELRLSPIDLPLELRARIGNGTGSPLGNDNALPAGYLAIDLVLGNASRHHRTADTGLRLGLAGFIEDSRDRDGIAGTTPLGFRFYRPAVVSGRRLVGEAHAIAWLGCWRLTLEGMMSDESRSRDDDGNPATPRLDLPSTQSHGLTVEAVVSLMGEARRPGQQPDTSAGSALELALRYDGLWLGRGAEGVTSGGAQGGAVGLTWWPTSYLAASLSGYALRYDAPPIETPDETVSWGVVLRTRFNLSRSD